MVNMLILQTQKERSMKLTITNIIERCGGSKMIARQCDGLQADSIRKWVGNGIPEKHWTPICKLHGKRLNANKLHDLNESIRHAKQ
jgi:predicted SpoU family rRNA methylase